MPPPAASVSSFATCPGEPPAAQPARLPVLRAAAQRSWRRAVPMSVLGPLMLPTPAACILQNGSWATTKLAQHTPEGAHRAREVPQSSQERLSRLRCRGTGPCPRPQSWFWSEGTRRTGSKGHHDSHNGGAWTMSLLDPFLHDDENVYC